MRDVLEKIDWERYELIPTITQEWGSNEILMFAYSSKQSLELSLQSQIAHYFSRSKQRIWQKGEQSGNTQKIKEVRLDCDNDSLIFLVEQKGVACHTGEKSCFFQRIIPSEMKDESKDGCKSEVAQSNGVSQVAPKIQSPYGIYHILDELYHIIEQKKHENPKTSYSASLFAKGANGICKKIVEEAGELCFAIKDRQESEIIYECADLLYHILVGLALEHINPERVLQELQRRKGQSGIEEKASRQTH